jgi:hypothetical protein
MLTRSLLVSCVFGLAAATATAQPAFRTVPDDDGCRDVVRDSSRPTWCELREATLPASDALAVDAAPNGGVKATGGERSDVLVRARVVATARNEAEARELVSQVTISTGPTIHASGPAARGAHWWVGFELSVPRRIDLELTSVNGPVSLSGTEGRVRLSTENGPVSVVDAAGSVTARTQNGPLDVRLSGSSWTGEGLDAETVNGPLVLRIPAEYDAQLEAGTTNGPLDLEYPLTVQGRMHHRIDATLGNGGAPVRARTTNGPATVRKR